MGKLAIVCGAPSTDHLAPFDDPEYEIWILGNQADRHIGKHVHKIFELHDNLDEHSGQYPDWLESLGAPLVVGENSVLNGEVFPYQQCADLIGHEYFTSSPACMLAYAILHGYNDISIYGVDMAMDDHEYFMQRACMEGWVGFARGRGIKITIPEKSTLCKWVYREGRDWPERGMHMDSSQYEDLIQTHNNAKAKIESELQKLSGVEQRLDTLRAQYQAHDGASQVYERLRKLERAQLAGIPVGNKEGVING